MSIHPRASNAVTFEQLCGACCTTLQQLLVSFQQAEQQIQEIQELKMPVSLEQEEKFLQPWRQQFAAWNDYASATRRLASFLRQQRQPPA